MGAYDSIVITGGRGMLADALQKTLAQRGLRVVALDRSACDVTSDAAARELFVRHRPTLLLNCAAHTKVDLCEDEPAKADAINGHAVGRLAALAREHGTFLVHFSTDFVFDGRGDRPYRADDPVNPLSAYGRSKLLGERLLQDHPPARWLILRTSWLYGPGGPNFPRTIVERARQGQTLKVVDDQIGSPTYTIDLAEATLALVDRNLGGLWHFANAGQTTWYDFARAALAAFSAPGNVAPISTAGWLALRPRQAVRPAYSVLDIRPLAEALGNPPRHWSQALAEFAAAVNAAGKF